MMRVSKYMLLTLVYFFKFLFFLFLYFYFLYEDYAQVNIWPSGRGTII